MVQFNTISKPGADVNTISIPDATRKNGLLAGRVVTKQKKDDHFIIGGILFSISLCAIGISLGMLMPACYVSYLSAEGVVALQVIGSKLLFFGVCLLLSASSTCVGIDVPGGLARWSR